MRWVGLVLHWNVRCTSNSMYGRLDHSNSVGSVNGSVVCERLLRLFSCEFKYALILILAGVCLENQPVKYSTNIQFHLFSSLRISQTTHIWASIQPTSNGLSKSRGLIALHIHTHTYPNPRTNARTHAHINKKTHCLELMVRGHQSSVHVYQKQVRVGLVGKVARWASQKPRAYRCSELEWVKRRGRRQYYFIEVNVIDWRLEEGGWDWQKTWQMSTMRRKSSLGDYAQARQ